MKNTIKPYGANSVSFSISAFNELSIHSRYADGTIVLTSQKPARISEPDPSASGPHAVLRWDTSNNRIYQRREYDAAGFPVRDVDFTNPTFRNGVPRPEHPEPPHQHRYVVNDPKVGLRSGLKRGRPEPLEEE